MTIEQIKILKDKVYELEGLLELAQLREDKIPELSPLIELRVAELVGGNEPQQASTAPAEEAPQPVQSIVELFKENDTTSVTSITSDISTTSESSEPDEPIVVAPAARAAKPAFTLNDRFRFRRELFGNSDEAFSTAMTRIAGMDNYEEAEEYFIGEEGWDPENPEVKDFMEIIKIYFGG